MESVISIEPAKETSVGVSNSGWKSTKLAKTKNPNKTWEE